MTHSPQDHLVGRLSFPESSANLPAEHVEMVMLTLITMLDECQTCTDSQVSWIAAEPARMLSLHEIMRMFAQVLREVSYRRAPEWAALELAVLTQPQRETMTLAVLKFLGYMVGSVSGYGSSTGSG